MTLIEAQKQREWAEEMLQISRNQTDCSIKQERAWNRVIDKSERDLDKAEIEHHA